MKPIVKRVLVATLLAAAVVAGVAARSYVTHRKVSPAFTLKSRLMTTGYVLEETKYVSSTGAVRTVQKDADGRSREWVFRPGEGGFDRTSTGEWVRDPRVTTKVLDEPPPYELAQHLESSPEFVRYDRLLGFDVIVTHVTSTAGHGGADFYTAPALGHHPLKIVQYGVDGQVVSTLEPLEAILGEPAATDVRGDFK